MARVVRIDTSEYVGYLADLSGPLERGAQGCIFDAWRDPDGRLRHEPPPQPPETAGPIQSPSRIRLSIPVRDPRKADLELMVPPDYLDFIQHHPAFHPFPPRRARL
jgi:hypothetical protein